MRQNVKKMKHNDHDMIIMIFIMDISGKLCLFLNCDTKWLISIGYHINDKKNDINYCLICSQSIEHTNYTYDHNDTSVICEICSSIINPINHYCAYDVIYRLVISGGAICFCGIRFSIKTGNLHNWDWVQGQRDNIVDIVKTLVVRNNMITPILFMMGICYDYESNVHILLHDVGYYILRLFIDMMS